MSSTTGVSGRQGWIDLSKGVAIVLVVAYHALLFLGSEDIGVWDFGRARIPLELFPMPAFFLLAGLLQPRMQRATWSQIWRRRLLPFAYVYVLWVVIRFVFFTAVPWVRTDGSWSSGRDPWLLLVSPFVPTSIYWFLWAMFVVTLGTWLLRRVDGRILMAVFGVVSVIFSSQLVTTGIFSFDRTLQYWFFFVLGVFAAGPISRFVRDSRARTWILLTLAFIAVSAVLVLVPISRRIPGAVLIGQLVSLAALFTFLSWWAPRRGNEWLARLGKESLVIYVLHIYFVAVLTIVVARLPFLHDVAPRGLPVVALVTALAILGALTVGLLIRRAPWLIMPPRRLRGAQERVAHTPSPRPEESRSPAAEESSIPSPVPGTIEREL